MFNNYFKSQKAKIIVNVIIGLIIYNMLVAALVKVENISPQSNLSDFQNAYWYSIVTLTTVGYGDLFPMTTYGRIIGGTFVLLSLVFYALVIGGISSVVLNLKESRKLGHNGTNFTSHAVIIGWNDFGNMVTDQLLGVGKQVAIVTNERNNIDFIHDEYDTKNIFTLYNDFKNFEFLRKINIDKSSIVFVNLDNDTNKLVFILNIRKVFPDLQFVVTLENGELKNTFIAAGVTNTISKHEISSKLLASYIFEPDVASYAESIMSFAQSDSDYDIKQFLVTSNNPYLGHSYQEAFFDLKKKYNSVLIGITKRDKFGNRKLIKNPLGELKIANGDYLLIILNGKAFKLLRKMFKVEEGFISQKAG